MVRNLRLMAFLAIAAPMPVLVSLGLRSAETGEITPVGAMIAFSIALLLGYSLFRMVRGLMRIPLFLIVLLALTAVTAGISL